MQRIPLSPSSHTRRNDQSHVFTNFQIINTFVRGRRWWPCRWWRLSCGPTPHSHLLLYEKENGNTHPPTSLYARYLLSTLWTTLLITYGRGCFFFFFFSLLFRYYYYIDFLFVSLPSFFLNKIEEFEWSLRFFVVAVCWCFVRCNTTGGTVQVKYVRI